MARSRGKAAERVELKNRAADAAGQLDALGASPVDKAEVPGAISDLVEDDEFWRYQARSTAEDISDVARAATFGAVARRVWLNGGRVLAVPRPGHPRRRLRRRDLGLGIVS